MNLGGINDMWLSGYVGVVSHVGISGKNFFNPAVSGDVPMIETIVSSCPLAPIDFNKEIT